jgi:hypothetical protein
MKTLTQIREASDDGKAGDKEAYQAFFKKALKKFGVTEPDQLKGDKEKEFYDYVDAGWKGDNEKPEKNEGISKSVTYGTMKGKKKKQVDESCGKDHSKMTGTCPECGKELSEDVIDENMTGIAKALTSISGKPEYKKIAKNLKSLAMRANEGDKGAAKQIKTQLAKLASKVDKKAGAKLTKMSKLAATYEEVEESVSVDMRTRGFKSAMARNLLRKEKAQSKKKSEIDEIIDATNRKLRGEDASIGAGSVDMGQGKPMKPMARRKKKGKHGY